jgi:flagellar biosynthesis/type III secretory pathway M-ring protein FliF/YscJ
MELPFTDMLKDFVSTWGSSIALSLFGLWALMLLKKSMPVSEAIPSTAALDKLTQAVTTAADAEVALAEATAGLPGRQAKALTNRDTLLTTVDEDPATAAAIISKWLQHA